jgi:predicted unusual protein kinase regulating ubiquinone biosynthesis (AarF/ABC1/UbiB family)
MNDVMCLDFHGVDKQALLRLVVHLWAYMLLNRNFFNADPHPGNLMFRLTKEGGVQPVLLDWGWVVKLAPEALRGWRGLSVALNEMDTASAASSLETLGYQNAQDHRAPERSVEFFAYLMRGTGSVSASKKSRDEFNNLRTQQKAADKEEGTFEKGGRKMKKIPDSFIFVTRVLGLLRGLCATLEVELPLLEILGCHARLATDGALALNAGENAASAEVLSANKLCRKTSTSLKLG